MKILPAGSATNWMKRARAGESPNQACAVTPSASPASSPISMRSGSPRLIQLPGPESA